jgi:hypothetical protein
MSTTSDAHRNHCIYVIHVPTREESGIRQLPESEYKVLVSIIVTPHPHSLGTSNFTGPTSLKFPWHGATGWANKEQVKVDALYFPQSLRA